MSIPVPQIFIKKASCSSRFLHRAQNFAFEHEQRRHVREYHKPIEYVGEVPHCRQAERCACGGGEYAAFAEKAIALGKQGAAWRKSVREGGAKPAAIECLSPKEQRIARLAAERATNREIAEKLFLSEGTVKQYINQIYSKLGIEGDTRTKRGALAALFGKN